MLDIILNILSEPAAMVAVVVVAGTIIGIFFPPAGALILRMTPVVKELSKQIPVIVAAVRESRVTRPNEEGVALNKAMDRAHAAVDKLPPIKRAAARAVLKSPAAKRAIKKKVRRGMNSLADAKF